MSNNKQDHIVDANKMVLPVEFLEKIFISIFINDEGFKKVINEAKLMEKKHILQALNDGKAMALGTIKNTSPEQYYKQTFGGNKL